MLHESFVVGARERELTLSSAAWSQTSSLFGHISQPLAMILRAATIFLAWTSSAAAAIQPGACFGLVLMTDSSRARARLMSLWGGQAIAGDRVKGQHLPRSNRDQDGGEDGN